MKREPRDITEIQEAIHPRDYRLFAGVIERNQWPLASRLLFHAFGGRLGDHRNWPEIDAWAESIARTLEAPGDPHRPGPAEQPEPGSHPPGEGER